ncbi:RNA polymerase sigma factor [Spiractinospora alimapuensis]|uniref:RNA polymerase sigma factor n=1 Tax=Spiractinospora alimapuensis TaxID=2820884 RepID=UPI001F1A2E93|nr:DUF6596 domain-containing protein [Spiractinospora alimapuensis]QVQ52628.1 RNA polymerase sigma factor [Spiractinospora alimapuensis]
MTDTAALLDHVWREDGARLLGALARRIGDLGLAEDALQEAAAEALRTWSTDPPPNPAGWLATTARRRAIDRLRRADTEDTKLRVLAARAEEPAEDAGDDVVALLFGCCDPTLPADTRVMLTLRAVCSLTVPEIASAFLTTPTAVTQRLTRCRRRLRDSGVTFQVPHPEEFAPRLDSVLATIYLLHNEGYLATDASAGHRPDLVATSVRLGRELTTLMPRETEVAGLTALMELNQARGGQRLDRDGGLLLLGEQDRHAWDQRLIAQASTRLERALARRRPGPYQVQAAIVALHTQAPDVAGTDWRQIRLLYDRLYTLRPAALVRLSRAVATWHVRGAGAALDEVDALRADLEGNRLFHATRSRLLEDLGRLDEATEATRRAVGLAMNPAERRLLGRRLHALSAR